MAEESKIKGYLEVGLWFMVLGVCMYFVFTTVGKLQEKIKERIAKELEEIKET